MYVWAAGGLGLTPALVNLEQQFNQLIEWLTSYHSPSNLSSGEYRFELFPVSDYVFFQNHYV